jgi:hypothetical protein
VATTVTEQINRSRRYLRDWGQSQDTITASTTSTATTLTVADASTAVYSPNWIIELDTEAIRVVSGSSTTLTVTRAYAGSTNTTHASGTTILIRPAFLSVDILDALNDGIQACFPSIYKPVSDTTLTSTSGTYEYTVPAMPSDSSVYIPYISSIDALEPGDTAYRPVAGWDVIRGATPKIRFRRQLTSGSTIRVNGFGPFPALALGGSMDTLWPRQADLLLPIYAAGWLLGSGEAARVRFDVGARDDREQANRTGSAMVAGTALMNRFYKRLADAEMPPMPRHVVSTI